MGLGWLVLMVNLRKPSHLRGGSGHGYGDSFDCINWGRRICSLCWSQSLARDPASITWGKGAGLMHPSISALLLWVKCEHLLQTSSAWASPPWWIDRTLSCEPRYPLFFLESIFFSVLTKRQEKAPKTGLNGQFMLSRYPANRKSKRWPPSLITIEREIATT